MPLNLGEGRDNAEVWDQHAANRQERARLALPVAVPPRPCRRALSSVTKSLHYRPAWDGLLSKPYSRRQFLRLDSPQDLVLARGLRRVLELVRLVQHTRPPILTVVRYLGRHLVARDSTCDATLAFLVCQPNRQHGPRTRRLGLAQSLALRANFLIARIRKRDTAARPDRLLRTRPFAPHNQVNIVDGRLHRHQSH